MNYGDWQFQKDQAAYWHDQYCKANKRAEDAIAEAKKSKERELTAIRLLLKYKVIL